MENQNKIYDLIIIGAGPAGITAAVYAARKRLDVLVITKDIGGQAAWSGDIENYTGYQFVTGPELVAKFEEHLRKYEITLRERTEVQEAQKAGDLVTVRTPQEMFQGRAMIITSGKVSRELGVPGESEFKNRGVSFCATCDGPLFSGKDVVVVGGGNSALDAVLQLTKIARRIYVVNAAPALGGDAIMREKVVSSNIVTVLNNSKVVAIKGDKFIKEVVIAREGREETLPVQGVFIEAGLVPNSGFAKDVEKNKFGEIKINTQNETNVPGIFAAGDVTDITEKQIIIAAGEGSKAALRAFRYLSRSKL